MEENNINKPEVIDLRVLAKKIRDNRKLFYKVLPIVFLVSCAYIFPQPRYYTADAKLAPEMGSSVTGNIGSIASVVGFDLSKNGDHRCHLP